MTEKKLDKQVDKKSTQTAQNISQPKVSALLNYKLEGFSVERLMHFLTVLDQDLEIVIREKPRSRRMGKITVRAASNKDRVTFPGILG